jgi:hypothetical protein
VATDALLAGVLGPDDSSDPQDLIAAAMGDVRVLGLPPPGPVPSGHPTTSDDLLSFLAQGFIHARGEVVEVVPEGVRFVDNSIAQVDLIIACTGFDVHLPFVAPEAYTRDGTPDLFMNIFSRSNDGLAVLGLSNLAGPTFPRLDDQVRAVMVGITLRELGGVDWRAWQSTLTTRPDLRGGARFTEVPANRLTVDDHTYSTQLRDLCDRFGYTPAGAWAGNLVESIPAPGLGAALRAEIR